MRLEGSSRHERTPSAADVQKPASAARRPAKGLDWLESSSGGGAARKARAAAMATRAKVGPARAKTQAAKAATRARARARDEVGPARARTQAAKATRARARAREEVGPGSPTAAIPATTSLWLPLRTGSESLSAAAAQLHGGMMACEGKRNVGNNGLCHGHGHGNGHGHWQRSVLILEPKGGWVGGGDRRPQL